MRLWPSLDRRRIYRYHDGQRIRAVDPLATYRALDRHPAFLLDRHVATLLKASSGELSFADARERRDFHEATEACVAAARDIFGVPSFEKGGLPEADCVALVLLFLACIDQTAAFYQGDADAAAFYGCDMERIRKTDYPRFIAYSLLMPRESLRRANDVRIGCVAAIESALANAPVPLGMLQAVVNDPDLATVLHAEQKDRMEAASD